MRDLRAILERVKQDRTSGASETFNYVLDDLIELIDSDVAPSEAEWSEFAISLYWSRRAMASLFWLSNTILLAVERHASVGSIRNQLENLKLKEKGANERISSDFCRTANADRILTISHSGTVSRAILALSQERTVEVVVMESLPGGEGVHTAKALSEGNVQVEVIPDSMVFAVMKDCDLAVCGADAIDQEAVVNKVGTYSMAMAAREMGKKCIVLASSSKCVPSRSEEVMGAGSLRDGLPFYAQVFEPVPLGCFDLAITDLGVLKPSQLAESISGPELADEWFAKGILAAKWLSQSKSVR